jgi:putative ABC transport system permease protein
MRSPVRDIRFGVRTLRKSPGFTGVAVLTLALGIGVTSAVFSIVNGVLFDGLPWGEPETVVSLELFKRKGDNRPRGATPAHYADFKQQSQLLIGLNAVQGDEVQFTDRDEPHLAYTPRVTSNAFQSMQVKPLLGRAFEAADGLPNAAPVIMLSEQLWSDRYGRDETLIGRSVEVDGEPVTVIGVVARKQWFPGPDAAAVLPLILPEVPSRSDERLGLYGRLKPGASLQELQSEVDLIMQRLAAQYPETDADYSVRVMYMRDRIVNENAQRSLYLLLGAVMFVLLIVCANLANLLLARGATREKEIATRSALGATRGQIVMQLLWECALIGALAVPVALLLARLCLDYFISLVPSRVTWIDQFFRFDARVALFAVIVTGLTVIAFGLAPALKASRLDLSEGLSAGGNRGGTDSGSHRLRSALVVTQIGLSLSLLVAASLFIQAFRKVQQADPGFEIDGIASASISLPESRYAGADKLRDFQRELDSALSGLPGGGRAALASVVPLGGWPGPLRDFQIAGRETAGREDAPRARWTSVSAEYFSTLGLQIQTGRGFSAADTASSQPVVIVTRSFAERFFAGQNPVGQRLALRALEGPNRPSGGSREIVGVVSDVRSFGGMRPPEWEPRIYEPITQQPAPSFGVVLRAAGPPLTGMPELRQLVRRLDPQLAVSGASAMHSRLEYVLWQSDFFASLMAILGGLALVLATIGVYGVVSYNVARRTREFGIRTALGAEPRQIATLVLRKTALLGGFGVALGLLMAALLSRGLQSMLYEISSRDPATLSGASLLLMLVTLAAGVIPMWRAVRVNPMESLRVE